MYKKSHEEREFYLAFLNAKQMQWFLVKLTHIDKKWCNETNNLLTKYDIFCKIERDQTITNMFSMGIESRRVTFCVKLTNDKIN